MQSQGHLPRTFSEHTTTMKAECQRAYVKCSALNLNSALMEKSFLNRCLLKY